MTNWFKLMRWCGYVMHTFLDIGAHKALFSRTILDFWPHALGILVEANAEHIPCLEKYVGSGKAFGPFLLEYSTMAPERFVAELRRAQAAVERGTHIYPEVGRELALTRWSWPDATTAQALLRDRVMREAVGGGDDHHGEPMEIRAQAVATRTVRSAAVEFPAMLRRVLVVAYRPTQTWVDAGTRSPVIPF